MENQKKSNYFLEWFKAVPAKWYGMVLILIAIIGATVKGIIWVINKGLDWWWITLYAVVVILFIVFSYVAFRKVAIDRDKYSSRQQRHIEFYKSRSELNKALGSPIEMIENCREVWLAWWTGSKVWQSEILKQPNIKRLIIQHPDYDLVRTFARAEKGDLEVYKRSIVGTTMIAMENNIPVVWVKEAIIGLTITKDKEGKGWARAEYFIPHSFTPDAYPSFVVYENKKDERDLYERLCKCYEDMFSSEINTKVTNEILQEWKERLKI